MSRVLEPPEQVVARVVGPGERVLWAGRPDAEAFLGAERRRALHRLPLQLAVLAATVWIAWSTLGRLGLTILPGERQLSSEVAGAVETQALPAHLLVLLAVGLLSPFVLYPLGRLWTVRRLRRYVQSLSYAITNRRLLILEDEAIRNEVARDEPRTLSILERTPGYDDVLFQIVERDRHARGTPDPIARERRQLAFKALPDAREIKRRIEDWFENPVEKQDGRGRLDTAQSEARAVPGLLDQERRRLDPGRR